MTNIVQFPSKTELPKKAIEARKKLQKVRKNYIDEIVEDCIDDLTAQWNSYGFYIKENADIHKKDYIAVRETMRALLYRYIPGVKHPLHEAIDYLIHIKPEKFDNKKNDDKIII